MISNINNSKNILIN